MRHLYTKQAVLILIILVKNNYVQTLKILPLSMLLTRTPLSLIVKKYLFTILAIYKDFKIY